MQSLFNFFKKTRNLLSQFWSFIKRIFTALQKWLVQNGPNKKTQKGALIAFFIATLAYLGYLGAVSLRLGYGLVVDVAIGLGIGIIGLFLFTAAARLALRIVSKIPLKIGSLFIGGIVTFMVFSMMPFKTTFPYNLWVIMAILSLGGSIYAIFWEKFKSSKLLNKIFVSLALIGSVASIVVFILWIGKTGTEEGLTKVKKYEQENSMQLDAPNPSLDGSFAVKTTSYGSGKDRRDIYGKDAKIITESVNAKPFVNKLSGRFHKLRKRFWGFNRTKFPINGRVWYPDGEGKFPLVLIVHGNHSMREYSDPGYAYLGEFLASRGFIVVSVDENFINGDWTQNYRTESDGRGWLMLKHLSVWRDWQKDPENPFYGKVDMENISLIGHSRGGEAVAIATSFNQLSHYPDDAKVKFDFNFNIKSVIAIAPVDGQYKPSDQPTPLKNINYLLLHGSHDSDVSSFSGDKQFKRIKFDDGEYKFKTSIYIYRANHGQFNTVWGNHDSGMPWALLLNTKALISGEEQRQIAKVYMGAFLETTLKGNPSYMPLFKDYRYAEEWLPETYYINRFEDSETQLLVDFDEDIDVTTTTFDGGKLMGEELRVWREEDFGFRRGSGIRMNKAVYLGWENPEVKTDSLHSDSTEVIASDDLVSKTDSCKTPKTFPSYTVKFPEIEMEVLRNEDLSLVFSIAQLDAKVPKHDSVDTSEEEENWSFNNNDNHEEEDIDNEKEENSEEANNKEDDNNENINEENNKNKKEDDKKDKKKKDEDEDEPEIPVDFTIELTDINGATSSVLASEIISIMPPLKTTYLRYKKMESRYGKSSEPTLQTVSIPMDIFTSKNPDFSVEGLNEIKFIFNKTNKAVIILDEIGFRKES